MMADGSARPSRSSDAGILRLPENVRNGSARSPKVIRAETAPACASLLFPLVNEDNEKQGCHTEIKARQVKWNDLA